MVEKPKQSLKNTHSPSAFPVGAPAPAAALFSATILRLCFVQREKQKKSPMRIVDICKI